jgi:hypothetical protein
VQWSHYSRKYVYPVGVHIFTLASLPVVLVVTPVSLWYEENQLINNSLPEIYFCFSCYNKRPSSVLECKIPERLSWPWSSEHNSGQFVFANSASYNTHTSRWWSEWNWLHFSQHWGVYGIGSKWKFTRKWHLWRYNNILCICFIILFIFAFLFCTLVYG